MAQCPACGGTGVYTGYFHWVWPFATECWTCGGSGQVTEGKRRTHIWIGRAKGPGLVGAIATALTGLAVLGPERMGAPVFAALAVGGFLAGWAVGRALDERRSDG